MKRCLTLVTLVLLLQIDHQAVAVSRSLTGLLQQYSLVDPPVVLDNMVIDGSGIAWNNSTGTLFAVRNSTPQVMELDQRGQVLRSVALQGFHDVEGITWLAGYRFAVVEERDCSVWLLDLPPGVSRLDKPVSPLFALPDLNRSGGNHGCEDLAWNPVEQVFYLVKEKAPALLLRVSGALPDAANQHQLQVALMPSGAAPGVLGSDLSGLYFDLRSGQLLVLSDESHRITAVDTTAGSAALAPAFELGWWSNGLHRGVPQAEGVAMAADGTLYVLSEPDLLYRFRRQQ